MSIKYKILLMLTFVTLNVSAQKDYKIDWRYEDYSIRDFFSKTEQQYNIRFLYKDEWIENLNFTHPYTGCKTLSCILDSLFLNTKLSFLYNSDNVLIAKDFSFNRNQPNEASQKPLISQLPKRSGQEPGKNQVIEIGNMREKNPGEKVVLSGYVINSETGEKIVNAAIAVTNSGIVTSTDANGHYLLNLSRGFYEIRVSSISFKQGYYYITLKGAGELNVEMERLLFNPGEVVVSAHMNPFLERYETGIEKINMKSYKLIPNLMGENDVLKSITYLPGVQSAGEGSAGINIRGGSADQNLILLYGAPLFNASHLFGFFSSINPDVISGITVFKGGIPSRFGGRLASVIDIETKDGDKKKTRGHIAASPVLSTFSIEGPLIKDTLSYMVGFRYNYSDYILSMLNDPEISSSSASFYDYNLKATYTPGKKNKMEVAGYHSHDYFKLNTRSTYKYDNNVLALKWEHKYTEELSSVISVNNSLYRYNCGEMSTPSEAYSLVHSISSTEIRADMNYLLSFHKINFGFDVFRYNLLPYEYNPLNDSSVVLARKTQKERAFESAVYLEDRISLSDQISLALGLRLSSFQSFGPGTTFNYASEMSRSESSITDTLGYRSGQIISSYIGPEFRLSLNYRLTNRNSIRFSINRTRQYLHLLSNTITIAPTDRWKLSDRYIKPQVADQVSLGFFQEIFANSVETSVEIYYKKIANAVDFKGGSILSLVDNFEQYAIEARGKAYGIELNLKKRTGKSQFDIAYTFSRTLLQSTGSYKDEIINTGKWYPANYDRPNVLVINYQFLYSRRFIFSTEYSYSTGRPVTYPVSTYKSGGNTIIYYSERNKYRIPDYSRLDVSCIINWNLKTKKIAHPSLSLSVINVLGKKNAYSVYFVKENDVIKGYKFSVFAQPVPSVTLSFDF